MENVFAWRTSHAAYTQEEILNRLERSNDNSHAKIRNQLSIQEFIKSERTRFVTN